MLFSFCTFFTNCKLNLNYSGDHMSAVPYALPIKTGVLRKRVKGKAFDQVEPIIRSSFPESWIFDDFSEYVY